MNIILVSIGFFIIISIILIFFREFLKTFGFERPFGRYPFNFLFDFIVLITLGFIYFLNQLVSEDVGIDLEVFNISISSIDQALFILFVFLFFGLLVLSRFVKILFLIIQGGLIFVVLTNIFIDPSAIINLAIIIIPFLLVELILKRNY